VRSAQVVTFSLFKTKVTKDITEFGYTTTIGLAQFHEQLLNRVIPVVKMGRPAKRKRTGKAGRLGSEKTTKQSVAKFQARCKGRSNVLCRDRDDNAS